MSYSLLLNGSPFGHFIPSRGLRQGDSLSPYLFILCSEVISRLMFRAERWGTLHGIPVTRSAEPISHLMFADDIILFCRANGREAQEIESIMGQYCAWSRQAINRQKSSIAFSSNTHVEVKASMLRILQLQEMRPGHKYLGLPLFLPHSRMVAFGHIREKILSKLSGWKAKVLSQAGHTVLLKTVAASMPLYPMSTFLLPKGWCKDLDRLFKKILVGVW